jgi:drug/metabolite transporter (DMT)-like permease
MTAATGRASADLIAAALWMTGAIASFTAMAVAGRAVSLDHDTFEILLYRSLFGLAAVFALATAIGGRHQITTRHLGIHAVRNVFHFAGQNLWLYAITVLPLAQVFALEFTSPIWATLLAPLVLAERLTLARIAAAALGFAGVLIVARPDFGAIDAGTLAAAGCALGFAGSALYTRKLTRSETTLCILFWLTLMQAGMGLAFAGADGRIAAPSLATLPWLAVIAVAGLLAHYCLTTALALAPAGVVMTMDFTRLPVIAAIGMVFYDEPVELWIVLGGAVIFAANWVNIRAARG